MTTHLDTSIDILGFPVSKLKALLASWNRTGKEPEELAALNDVAVGPGAAAALLGEAWRLGLIGFTQPDMPMIPTSRVGLTDAGRAFRFATGRGRTSKDKAGKILQQILSRAQNLLEDGMAPVRIHRIWVFGSFVKPEKPDVGDLDIVVETVRTGIVSYRGMESHILENYPGLLPDGFDSYRRSAEEVFVDKKLYGGRRHPLIAPNDIGTLVDMHEPCGLFFDADRGGRITPEIHPHHPESQGRRDSIREPLMMPDLVEAEDLELTNPIVVDSFFGSGAREESFGGMHYRAGDGWDEFFLRGGHDPDSGVLVRRETDLGEVFWDCSMSVSPVGRTADDQHAWSLARSIVLLAHADLLRLAAHRHKLGGMQEIDVDICLDESYREGHPLRTAVRNRSEVMESVLVSDQRPTLPAHMAFGAFALFEGNGSGLCRPCDLTDGEWENQSFPFTREEYEEWAAQADAGHAVPSTP